MAQMLAANASWFNFTAQSGDFGVYAFSGFEEVCKPYEFGIELVSRPANVGHRQDHLSRSVPFPAKSRQTGFQPLRIENLIQTSKNRLATKNEK